MINHGPFSLWAVTNGTFWPCCSEEMTFQTVHIGQSIYIKCSQSDKFLAYCEKLIYLMRFIIFKTICLKFKFLWSNGKSTFDWSFNHVKSQTNGSFRQRNLFSFQKGKFTFLENQYKIKIVLEMCENPEKRLWISKQS